MANNRSLESTQMLKNNLVKTLNKIERICITKSLTQRNWSSYLALYTVSESCRAAHGDCGSILEHPLVGDTFCFCFGTFPVWPFPIHCGPFTFIKDPILECVEFQWKCLQWSKVWLVFSTHFLFSTAGLVGFQSLGLGLVRRFLVKPKNQNGTGTLELWYPAVGLQSWITFNIMFGSFWTKCAPIVIRTAPSFKSPK